MPRPWSFLSCFGKTRSAQPYPRKVARRANPSLFAAAKADLRVRLLLEALEDRLAPAVSWTGGAGTLNWGDAGNWSNTAVPGSADDVTINKSGIGTINISAGTYAVRSLNDTTASLSIASGASLSLAAVAATSTFGQNVTVQSGATLTVGAGASVLLQTGQTLAVNGAMTLASGDTLSLNSNYPGGTQVVVGGTLTATGAAVNDPGQGYSATLTVNPGGHLIASGSTFAVGQLTLTNGSTDTLGTDIFSGVLAINSGATLSITANDFSNLGTNGVVATGNANSTINLLNNYWGTTNPTSIAAKILDHVKDSTRPTVSYNPFLSLKPVVITAANVAALFSTAQQNVTFSATVTGPYGIVNEGSVTFTILNGATVIGNPGNVNVTNGAASGTYTLPAGTSGGTYTIQAVYSGSANYNSFTDNTHFLTVGAQATITSATNASATYNLANQAVVLSASVTFAGSAVNDGTETFSILSGSTTIGNPVTANVSAGSAAVSYTLPGGTLAATYTIQAVYNGTASFGTSTDSSHSLIVNAAATTTAAANVSTPYSVASQDVSLSASVSSPAGTVSVGIETFTILSGSTVIGSPVTVGVSAGTATTN